MMMASWYHQHKTEPLGAHCKWPVIHLSVCFCIFSYFFLYTGGEASNTTWVTSLFSFAPSLEDTLKRANCHHKSTGARWLISVVFKFLSDRKDSLICCLLLFSLDLGRCQCKVEREGRHGEGDQCDSGIRVPKKSFFFLFFVSAAFYEMSSMFPNVFCWKIICTASYNFWKKWFLQAACCSAMF